MIATDGVGLTAGGPGMVSRLPGKQADMKGRDVTSALASTRVAETRILFVSHVPGGRSGALARGRFGPGIEVVNFPAVTAELLAGFDPHFVVSPMLTPSFDILDLALVLSQLRYHGAYRVLTETPLPNPDLVLREVRLHCPGLDIDLLSMDKLRG